MVDEPHRDPSDAGESPDAVAPPDGGVSSDAGGRLRGDRAPADPVEALRDALPEIRTLPVQDRVESFEHANAVLASALAELDEV